MHSSWLSRIVLVLLVACGGGKGGGPGPDVDGGIDPGSTTRCGTLLCNSALEICVVKTPEGPSQEFACEPIPTGCLNDRSCGCAGELCIAPFDACFERDTPNTLFCECLACGGDL